MQIPKMYGESLAHGLSYKPLKKLRFSAEIRLGMRFRIDQVWFEI